MSDSSASKPYKPMRRLMIVDDDHLTALNLANRLLPFGFELCSHCYNESQVFRDIEERKPEIILLDINLGSGGSGISIAQRLKKQYSIPFVYLTAYSDNDIMSAALATAPYGYVIKPAKPIEITAALETALIRYQMETKEQNLSKRYHGIYDKRKIATWCSHDSSQLVKLTDQTSLINNIGLPGVIAKNDLLQMVPEHEQPHLNSRLKRQDIFCQRIGIPLNRNDQSDKTQWLDLFIVDYEKASEYIFIGLVIDSTENINLIDMLDSNPPLADSIDTGFIFLNSEFHVVSANHYIYQLLGYRENELAALDIQQITAPDRREENTPDIKQQPVSSRFEFNLRSKSGTIIPALAILDKISFDEGSDQYILSITNLSNIRSRHQALSRLAFTDPLTGLGNRAYFYRLFDLIDQKKIQPTERICCLLIDLDSFKLINDNLGHSVGDDVLKVVSERLKTGLRGSDYLVRLGGDEFAIVIIDGPQDSTLEQLAKKLIRTIRRPIYMGEESFSLTCSIGISARTCKRVDPDKLLREADIAMYRAKSLGKDQFTFFRLKQGDAPLSPLVLEQGLRKLIKENSLIAHYQPILDSSENIIAFEVLARWFHEKHHWISPPEFITVAEQSGLIHAVGDKMLQQACIAIKLLEHTKLRGLLAYVNVSPYQLRRKSFIKQAMAIVSEFEVAPSRIVFEITETSMTHTDALEVIGGLQKQGFQLAVDDFGTGYSALANLKDCFANTIKLDKSFLQLADTSPRDRMILERVTDLCLALGYDVLAEGIETKSQLDRARKCGCRLFQGFYFQAPLDLQHLMQLGGHTQILSNGAS